MSESFQRKTDSHNINTSIEKPKAKLNFEWCSSPPTQSKSQIDRGEEGDDEWG